MKQITLYAAACLIGFSGFAQKKIKVEEKNDGGHNALVTTIYEAGKDDIEKAWRSEIKKFGGKITQGGMFADDCKWSKMGDNTFDVISKVKNASGEAVELIVSVDLGGAYLSSSQHHAQYKAMRNFLYDFALKTSRKAIEKQIKEAESMLATLEKEQKKLLKENEKLHALIEDCKEKIAQAEEDIKENEQNQSEKTKEIEEQTKAVEEVKGKLNAIN